MSRVESIKDRNNRTRTFSYDINDNLKSEAWDNGTQLTYTYDKVSNLKTNYDPTSNTTNSYNYDAIYQLTDSATNSTTGNTRFHYNYDIYGDITKREDWVNSSQIATLDYTYNKNRQLTSLKQTGTGVVAQDINFTYDRLSQLTKTDRTTASNPGHLITDYQYDAVGLLSKIDNYFNTPTTGISNYNYSYDAGNRLILTTGTDGNSAVDYGNDNQLKTIDNATRADEAYNFNQLGIRDTWSTVTGDSRRLFNDGKYEYRYDDEGNLTQKKELLTGNLTTYEWDYRNRLAKVVSGSQTVEYGYDAEDKRVSKKLNGVTTEKYVYDGSDIALVLNAAGTLVERYLYGAGVDNVLSREKSGVVVWSLGDRQGSVVDLVSENGTILNHFVYDGFGNRTGTTSADFRYGYTGRELDTETGLYYYRARYYDPQVGRFISEDPIGFAAGDTNLYRYVNNNPTNYTDPSGEIAFLAPAALAWGAYFVVSAGLAAAATSAAWGFARGVAESIDSDRRNGILGWDSIGSAYINGLIGAGKGAVGGFVTGVTTAALTLGAIYLAVPGAVITGIGLTIGTIGVGTGLINAGVNFAQGNYATGFVDLAGAIHGGSRLWSDYQDSQLRWYEEPSLPPSNGAGSGLATMPDWSQGGNGSPMILPGGTGENGSTKMPSNVTVDPIVQETQSSELNIKGGGFLPDEILPAINETETTRIEKQSLPLACGISCAQALLKEAGVYISQQRLIEIANTEFVSAGEIAELLNNVDDISGKKWYGQILDKTTSQVIQKLNENGSWGALISYGGQNHWVVVDGSDRVGHLNIRDPWGKTGLYDLQTPATEYQVRIEDFKDRWLGRVFYGMLE